MKRLLLYGTLLFLASAAAAQSEWEPVVPGVDYQHFREGAMDIHVARIDLTSDTIRIIATRQSDVGTRVSDFAQRSHAVVAINGDYFDKVMKPIGLVVGACGQWSGTKDTSREGVVAFGEKRGEIRTQSEVMDPPEPWITTAVSGWPMLVRECHALTSAELPGSDGFTRSPHGRTAVGVSKDGATAYFVVADGRRSDAPGLTLGQLAAWMATSLEVCSAINLDGGGSSTMWVAGHVVNKPSDGIERNVADHLAVVAADEQIACDIDRERQAATALAAASAKLAAAAAKVPADNARATITTVIDGTTSSTTTVSVTTTAPAAAPAPAPPPPVRHNP